MIHRAFGSALDVARAYTRVYGKGVAVVPERDGDTKDALRELGWHLIEAESLSDYWAEVSKLDDPVIVADQSLEGFPRKCHVLLEGMDCPERGSPVAVMASNCGVITTPYKHFLEILSGN